MTDAQVISELQEGIRELKQQRIQLKQKNVELENQITTWAELLGSTNNDVTRLQRYIDERNKTQVDILLIRAEYEANPGQIIVTRDVDDDGKLEMVTHEWVGGNIIGIDMLLLPLYFQTVVANAEWFVYDTDKKLWYVKRRS